MASKIDTYIRDRLQAGKSTFVFRGGRRSGKTFGILKFLMRLRGEDVQKVEQVDDEVKRNAIREQLKQLYGIED